MIPILTCDCSYCKYNEDYRCTASWGVEIDASGDCATFEEEEE